MEHQEAIDAPESACLVCRAANGDGTAWERLVSHYDELVVGAAGVKLANGEIVWALARHGPKTDESLRAADRVRATGNALASLPLRWQRLLQLLSADPFAQHLR
jgi:hypothetical protein